MSSAPESPAPRRGLGRGLEVLLGGGGRESDLLHLPVAAIHPNPRQPRRRFEPQATAGLAASLRHQGVLRGFGAAHFIDAGQQRLPRDVRMLGDARQLPRDLLRRQHQVHAARCNRAARHRIEDRRIVLREGNAAFGFDRFEHDDAGVVFRDLITLALCGFVVCVVLIMPHINPPVTKTADGTDPPGNVIVEVRWPDEIDADDSVASQVTFSGAASAAVYQQVLQSVTLTSATAGVQTVSFEVTDVDGNTNVLPAATAVTVVGLGAVEVAPVVIVAPAAATRVLARQATYRSPWNWGSMGCF